MNDCYLVVRKEPQDIVLSSDSASDVSVYMWGRSSKDYTLYKVVRIDKIADVMSIKKELEER